MGISVYLPLTVKSNLTLQGLKIATLCMFGNTYNSVFSQSMHTFYVFYEVLRSTARSGI